MDRAEEIAEKVVTSLIVPGTVWKETISSALRSYRDDALEEGAKIAEFHSGPSIQLADKIRALKSGEGELMFTDDDLKRFEELIQRDVFPMSDYDVHEVRSLMVRYRARLEAAEFGCKEAERILINPIEMNSGNLEIVLEAWRKLAEKEKS